MRLIFSSRQSWQCTSSCTLFRTHGVFQVSERLQYVQKGNLLIYIALKDFFAAVQKFLSILPLHFLEHYTGQFGQQYGYNV